MPATTFKGEHPLGAQVGFLAIFSRTPLESVGHAPLCAGSCVHRHVLCSIGDQILKVPLRGYLS